MTDKVEMVSIPLLKYVELVEASDTLDALHAAGVDNWDGYAYAVEFLEDDDEDNEE